MAEEIPSYESLFRVVGGIAAIQITPEENDLYQHRDTLLSYTSSIAAYVEIPKAYAYKQLFNVILINSSQFRNKWNLPTSILDVDQSNIGNAMAALVDLVSMQTWSKPSELFTKNYKNAIVDLLISYSSLSNPTLNSLDELAKEIQKTITSNGIEFFFFTRKKPQRVTPINPLLQYILIQFQQMKNTQPTVGTQSAPPIDTSSLQKIAVPQITDIGYYAPTVPVITTTTTTTVPTITTTEEVPSPIEQEMEERQIQEALRISREEEEQRQLQEEEQRQIEQLLAQTSIVKEEEIAEGEEPGALRSPAQQDLIRVLQFLGRSQQADDLSSESWNMYFNTINEFIKTNVLSRVLGRNWQQSYQKVLLLPNADDNYRQIFENSIDFMIQAFQFNSDVESMSFVEAKLKKITTHSRDTLLKVFAWVTDTDPFLNEQLQEGTFTILDAVLDNRFLPEQIYPLLDSVDPGLFGIAIEQLVQYPWKEIQSQIRVRPTVPSPPISPYRPPGTPSPTLEIATPESEVTRPPSPLVVVHVPSAPSDIEKTQGERIESFQQNTARLYTVRFNKLRSQRSDRGEVQTRYALRGIFQDCYFPESHLMDIDIQQVLFEFSKQRAETSSMTTVLESIQRDIPNVSVQQTIDSLHDFIGKYYLGILNTEVFDVLVFIYQDLLVKEGLPIYAMRPVTREQFVQEFRKADLADQFIRMLYYLLNTKSSLQPVFVAKQRATMGRILQSTSILSGAALYVASGTHEWSLRPSNEAIFGSYYNAAQDSLVYALFLEKSVGSIRNWILEEILLQKRWMDDITLSKMLLILQLISNTTQWETISNLMVDVTRSEQFSALEARLPLFENYNDKAEIRVYMRISQDANVTPEQKETMRDLLYSSPLVQDVDDLLRLQNYQRRDVRLAWKELPAFQEAKDLLPIGIYEEYNRVDAPVFVVTKALADNIDLGPDVIDYLLPLPKLIQLSKIQNFFQQYIEEGFIGDLFDFRNVVIQSFTIENYRRRIEDYLRKNTIDTNRLSQFLYLFLALSVSHIVIRKKTAEMESGANVGIVASIVQRYPSQNEMTFTFLVQLLFGPKEDAFARLNGRTIEDITKMDIPSIQAYQGEITRSFGIVAFVDYVCTAPALFILLWFSIQTNLLTNQAIDDLTQKILIEGKTMKEMMATLNQASVIKIEQIPSSPVISEPTSLLPTPPPTPGPPQVPTGIAITTPARTETVSVPITPARVISRAGQKGGPFPLPLPPESTDPERNDVLKIGTFRIFGRVFNVFQEYARLNAGDAPPPLAATTRTILLTRSQSVLTNQVVNERLQTIRKYLLDNNLMKDTDPFPTQDNFIAWENEMLAFGNQRAQQTQYRNLDIAMLNLETYGRAYLVEFWAVMATMLQNHPDLFLIPTYSLEYTFKIVVIMYLAFLSEKPNVIRPWSNPDINQLISNNTLNVFLIA